MKFQRNADKTWKDASPGLKEFSVDSDKVTQLLDILADRKESRLVDRLVFLKGVPKAEHKFAAKDAAIQLEATLEDGKKVTLTVGAPIDFSRMQKYYFAQVSTWPGVVFLTPSGWVNDLLDNLRYFAKERAASAP